MYKRLARVGHTYVFNSREGGGSYTVVGHINCDRCNTVVEDREWQSPTKTHRQKGQYYERCYWCWKCGLWKPKLKTYKKIVAPKWS